MLGDDGGVEGDVAADADAVVHRVRRGVDGRGEVPPRVVSPPVLHELLRVRGCAFRRGRGLRVGTRVRWRRSVGVVVHVQHPFGIGEGVDPLPGHHPWVLVENVVKDVLA